MESAEIDLLHLRRSTLALQKRYELVLLEGVGGLLVPLTPDLLFADYIRGTGYPLLMVSSPRLGSINHTLLSIEACLKRSIALRGVIYNCFQNPDQSIVDDTRAVIQHSLKQAGYSAPVIDLRNGELDADDLLRLSLY